MGLGNVVSAAKGFMELELFVLWSTAPLKIA